MPETKCPLCCSSSVSLAWEQTDNVNWSQYAPYVPAAPRSLRFFACSICRLVFKDPVVFRAVEAGRALYTQHQNDLENPGYRAFLSRLSGLMSERVPSGASGLDYGCGPTRALETLFIEHGFACDSYDPLFRPREEFLRKQYDFVSCSEVAEHFTAPAAEFQRLRDLLKPSGWLGVMTSFVPADKPLSAWHYHVDPTHVVFYAAATMEWIAREFDFDACETEKNALAFLRARS